MLNLKIDESKRATTNETKRKKAATATNISRICWILLLVRPRMSCLHDIILLCYICARQIRIEFRDYCWSWKTRRQTVPGWYIIPSGKKRHTHTHTHIHTHTHTHTHTHSLTHSLYATAWNDYYDTSIPSCKGPDSHSGTADWQTELTSPSDSEVCPVRI